MSAHATDGGAVMTGRAPAITLIEIEARNLAHRYGARAGLEPLSFHLASPGVVAVTGPNGSGKSTLLRILAGLMRPSDGACDVSVAGRFVVRAERRRAAGYAAPDLAFYEEFSAAENLAFAAEARGLADIDRIVRAALDAVGLGARAEDRVAAFSSGMKQRLRLAFALLHDPPLLLFDEPGSHLDEDGRVAFEALLQRAARTKLVVLATNDPREWNLAEQRIELRSRGLGGPA